MNRYFDNHFKREVVTIYPGEFYSTKGDEMISTVLGSCVSVVLYDSVNKVGGINHYMLARDTRPKNSIDENSRISGRFGEYAIDMLIEDLKKKGGNVENLEAKVFGGGNIFNMANSDSQVGNVNSRFAFERLKELGIPVIKSDTGGTLPRKIFFEPETNKVFMKYIDNRREEETDTGKFENPFAAIEIKTVKNLFENN